MLWHRTGGLGLGLVTSPISAPISAPLSWHTPLMLQRHPRCASGTPRCFDVSPRARLKFGGPQASSGGSLPVGKVRRSVPALVPGRGIDARNGFRGLRIGQHTTDPLRRRPCPPRPRAVGCVRGSSVSRTASRSRQSLQRVAPSACARGSHQRSAGGGLQAPSSGSLARSVLSAPLLRDRNLPRRDGRQSQERLLECRLQIHGVATQLP